MHHVNTINRLQMLLTTMRGIFQVDFHDLAHGFHTMCAVNIAIPLYVQCTYMSI